MEPAALHLYRRVYPIYRKVLAIPAAPAASQHLKQYAHIYSIIINSMCKAFRAVTFTLCALLHRMWWQNRIYYTLLSAPHPRRILFMPCNLCVHIPLWFTLQNVYSQHTHTLAYTHLQTSPLVCYWWWMVRDRNQIQRVARARDHRAHAPCFIPHLIYSTPRKHSLARPTSAFYTPSTTTANHIIYICIYSTRRRSIYTWRLKINLRTHDQRELRASRSGAAWPHFEAKCAPLLVICF